eukprot:754753-Hanusia_phi.AAC.3
MSSTSGPSSAPLSSTAYKLFAGRSLKGRARWKRLTCDYYSANPELAEKVSEALGIPLGKATVGRFNDGECNIQLGENVRNTHVFLVQSTCPPVNDAMMELFLMVRCFRRASARTVTAIVPYYGYARQHAFVEHVPFMVKEIIPSYGDNPIAIVSPDAGGEGERGEGWTQGLLDLRRCGKSEDVHGGEASPQGFLSR